MSHNKHVKHGLVAVDTFDRRVAEMGLEGRPAGAPAPAHVVCEEPKTGIWSGNNNLGYEVAFAPNADNRQTILKMPEWGFPETWTISLGITETPVDLANFNGRNITAIIEFGVGGFTQTIEVDWKLGTVITLVTNSLNVIAEFADIDVGAGEGDFKLSVQLCRGNRASSPLAPTKVLVTPPDSTGDLGPNRILEAVVLFAGQVTGLIPIPRFATVLHILPAALATADNLLFANTTFITIRTGTGAGSKSIVVMDGVALLAAGGVIPIFGSALALSIVNTAPGPFNDDVGFSVFAELAG